MKYLIATLMFSSLAHADGLTIIPSLDSIHIGQAIFPNQPDDADKLQKALVVQTGFEEHYNEFKNKTNQKFSVYGEKAITDTEKFIDEETPLSSKAVAITAATAYTFAVTRSYTQNLGDPLISGVSQTLTIAPDKITTGIKYSF